MNPFKIALQWDVEIRQWLEMPQNSLKRETQVVPTIFSLRLKFLHKDDYVKWKSLMKKMMDGMWDVRMWDDQHDQKQYLR